MKRLLCIMGGMNVGGAETFIMKVYRNIDKSRYQFDFCINTPIEDNYYAKEIQDLGGHIYVTVPKSSGLFKQCFAIREIVKKNHYIHVLKVKQHSLACIDLLAAKAGGATVLAMRSTNSLTGGLINEVLHKLFAFLPRIIPTIKIAPSDEAGRYTFGRKQLTDGKVTIINNGLDVEKYRFNYELRCKNRKKWGICDKHLVIGHIGRFNKQKNHRFLIDVFCEIRKRNSTAVLFLVGVGELENETIEKVRALGLNDYVIFAGLRDDVSELLSAIDVIIFPSFYEGLPNTIIEAQACGIPCLISDTISRQVAITDLVYFISIKENADFWASEMEKIYTANREREKYATIVKKMGYDISDCAEKIINLVFEGNK